MNPDSLRKSAIRIIIWIGVFFAVLAAVGIGEILWKSYKNPRTPVYQSTMTDFEIPDEFVLGEHVTQKFNEWGIKQLDCFIFHGHSHHPNYYICVVGKFADNTILPKPCRTHSFADNVDIFTALNLAGANADYSENLYEIDTWLYLYKNRIIYKIAGKHSKFLTKECDKQSYLEKHIRPRSEKGK